MAEPMSRTERRRAEREAKKNNQQRQKKKRSPAEKAVILVVTALLLGGGGYWIYRRAIAATPGQFVASLGNRHVSQAEVGVNKYNSDPPTSGPHLPMIATWGIHQEPVTKELQVHNLEDGGVAIQYNCPATTPECSALVDKLAAVARKYDHVIMAPYPGMSNKIALTAWTRIDKFDEFDENRIARFIEAYIHIDHHPVGGES